MGFRRASDGELAEAGMLKRMGGYLAMAGKKVTPIGARIGQAGRESETATCRPGFVNAQAHGGVPRYGRQEGEQGVGVARRGG